MLAFLLITAHLNAFASGRPPQLASPVPKTLAALKAQPMREFLDTGRAEIEVDIQLKNSALRPLSLRERQSTLNRGYRLFFWWEIKPRAPLF